MLLYCVLIMKCAASVSLCVAFSLSRFFTLHGR